MQNDFQKSPAPLSEAEQALRAIGLGKERPASRTLASRPKFAEMGRSSENP